MSIIIMLLLLSLLIIIHEIGHLIAALSFGIKVEKFGFGLPLGPTLFEKKVGDVTVMVHALLLGGYVAFAEDSEDCDLPEDSPQRFLNKPIWQRLIVVSAGVIANVICAFFLVLFSALVWNYLPSGEYDVKIVQIIAPKEASVWKSGLQTGDRLVTINGERISNPQALLSIIQLSKAHDSLVTREMVENNFVRLKKLNPAFSKSEVIPPDVVIRLPEFMAEQPVVIGKTVALGIKPYKDNQYKISSDIAKLRDSIGDLQKSTYYVSTGHFTMHQLAEAISDTYRPINFVVERDGKYIKLKSIYPTSSGSVGIQLESKEKLKQTHSLWNAITGSAHYLIENTYLMLVGLKQVFTGEVPIGDLHGIVAITKVGGDIINNNGIFYGLLLTAIISMDLAIVNFLPIPALDGGHVMFLIIEKIRGKRVSDKVIEKIANVSFLLLIALMVFVIFNDIYALITQKL